MGPPPVRMQVLLNRALQSCIVPPSSAWPGSISLRSHAQLLLLSRSITGHATWVSARWSASGYGGAAGHASARRAARHGQRRPAGYGNGGTTRGHAAAGGPTTGNDLPRATSMPPEEIF